MNQRLARTNDWKRHWFPRLQELDGKAHRDMRDAPWPILALTERTLVWLQDGRYDR